MVYDLEAIRAGKKPDPEIKGDDIVVVQKSSTPYGAQGRHGHYPRHPQLRPVLIGPVASAPTSSTTRQPARNVETASDESSHNPPDASGHQTSRGRALIERPDQLPSTLLLEELQRRQGDDDDTIDLRRYWEIIVKRRWTVLTFFLIVVVAIMTATFLMTKIYRSSLTLQIDQQESKVTQIQDVTPTETAAGSKDFYQTQYELLQSRTLAERVIDQLNLSENPLFVRKPSGLASLLDLFRGNDDKGDSAGDKQTQMVNAFLKQLTIEPVRNSRLVKIEFDSPDPQLSARVANAISQAFINLSLERRMDASSFAKTFLQDRLQQMKVKLEDSERKLNEYARAQEIVRTDDKQGGPDAQVLQEFTTALAKAQEDRIKAETIYNQIKEATSGGFGAILDNPVIQEYKTRKAKLETEYQENLQDLQAQLPQDAAARGPDRRDAGEDRRGDRAGPCGRQGQLRRDHDPGSDVHAETAGGQEDRSRPPGPQHPVQHPQARGRYQPLAL